jgi:hypothetical protein
MAVVYTHQRLDNNEVFYVGIGKTSRRAFSKNDRSKYWTNIIKKTNYIVDILHSDVSWEEACELEKHLIFLYGRKNLGLGLLVNMTDGGEGSIGVIVSDETRKKLSISRKGEKNYAYGKIRSDEHKQKISKAHKGKTHSDETKKKISDIHRNKEGVKGYYFNKARNKYMARINVGGKNIYIGLFNTPEEAELAYKQAKEKYHI